MTQNFPYTLMNDEPILLDNEHDLLEEAQVELLQVHRGRHTRRTARHSHSIFCGIYESYLNTHAHQVLSKQLTPFLINPHFLDSLEYRSHKRATGKKGESGNLPNTNIKLLLCSQFIFKSPYELTGKLFQNNHIKNAKLCRGTGSISRAVFPKHG